MRIRFFSLLISLAAAGALAQATDPGSLVVTSVAGRSVYVSSGSEDGLEPGTRLEVVRDQAPVADLTVTEVSAHRSRCAAGTAAPEIRVGDTVRLASAAPQAGAAPGTVQEPDRERHPLGLRGRLGLRYLYVDRTSGIGGGYSQPALDLRLDGRDVAGSAIGLAVDVRTRRTYRREEGGDTDTENRNRVYRLSASYGRADKPLRVGLGRQFAPSLAVVSLFDGVYAEYRKERWAAGGFYGTEPDPEDWTFSNDVRGLGGFFEYGNAPAAPRRWAVTTGAVSSTEEGEVNRDFLFVQGRYDDRKLSGYLAQEIDVNRGWRKDAESGDSFTATSTFASLRYRFGDALAVRAGYDDRRSVRLYRDLVTPETEFDDTYRQGVWAGVDGRAGRHLQWGVDARSSSGGAAGSADSYTGMLGAVGLTRLGLGARVRSTRYESDVTEGWLHALSVSSDLASWTRLEIHGGLRTESPLDPAIPEGDLSWFGLDWEACFGRHWLLSLTADRNLGADEDNDQVYATVSWRF